MDHTKTFREVASAWADSKRHIVKHSTMCAYALILKTHLIPVFGECEEISEDDAQAFVIQKLSHGLARKTVRDIVAVMKSVTKYGKKHQLFPYEDWEIAFPTDAERKRLPVLSIAHQRKLMKHLLDDVTPQNIGVLLALCTGMRIGEVCGLQWTDVDLAKRVITVNRTVGRIYDCEKGATSKIQSTPKTKTSSREIPISNHLLGALKTIKNCDHNAYVVGCGTDSKEPRSYRDYFSRMLKRLKIPAIVFHGLRHTFATRCIESQCDYKTVSVILGHSNVATTLNLYVHPNFNQKKRCVDRMSKFLGVEVIV